MLQTTFSQSEVSDRNLNNFTRSTLIQQDDAAESDQESLAQETPCEVSYMTNNDQNNSLTSSQEPYIRGTRLPDVGRVKSLEVDMYRSLFVEQ